MAMGEDRYFVWDYNERSDILNIHRKGRKVEGSGEFSDFSVDFDKSGNVVGVEMVYASEFLGQIGVQRIQLSELKGAEVTVSKKANYALIWVKLAVPEHEAIVEKKLPLPVPIVA